VEASDLTALVIRALGLIVGKMIAEARAQGVAGVAGVAGVTGDTRSKQWFVQTALVTGAAQQIAEALELDMNEEHITTARIGRVLKKMRLPNERHLKGGKRG